MSTLRYIDILDGSLGLLCGEDIDEPDDEEVKYGDLILTIAPKARAAFQPVLDI